MEKARNGLDRRIDKPRVFYMLVESIEGPARVAEITNMGDRRGYFDFLYMTSESRKNALHEIKHLRSVTVLLLRVAGRGNGKPWLQILKVDHRYLAGALRGRLLILPASDAEP